MSNYQVRWKSAHFDDLVTSIHCSSFEDALEIALRDRKDLIFRVSELTSMELTLMPAEESKKCVSSSSN